MDRKCVVCHSNPASVRCIQCHKSVCSECAFKTEHGAFCSRGCAAAYRDFKKAEGASVRRNSGLLAKLIVFIVLLVVAVGVAYVLKPEWFREVSVPTPGQQTVQPGQ